MSAIHRRWPMIRISLPYVYQLADQLDDLESLPEKTAKLGEVWPSFFIAQSAVDTLITTSVYAPYLRTSQAAAQELLKIIRAQTSQPYDAEREINQFDLWNIKRSYRDYKIALLAELGALGSYFVTQKGGYDTYTLLNFAELLFPADLVAKVPEAVFDAREAGRCLAYEVPTACGFHVFRVTESVLRKYYAQVTGGAAPPKVRSLGVYINALKIAKKGNEKIISALKQMTDLHRNPLIHPETVLTVDEAIAIFGIARSAITAMLAALPIVPPTTAVVTASPAPAVAVGA